MSRLVKCENGHFYDADKYAKCPNCSRDFVVAVILICGIGGLTVNFGKVTLTSIACALILGIITNAMLSKKGKKA